MLTPSALNLFPRKNLDFPMFPVLRPQFPSFFLPSFTCSPKPMGESRKLFCQNIDLRYLNSDIACFEKTVLIQIGWLLRKKYTQQIN